jgi:hypothetical protein
MLIELRTTTLEIILSLRVYDSKGSLIPRVVGIDTEKKIARQCLTDKGKVHFQEIPFERFEFCPVPPTQEAELLAALPPELHEYIVPNSEG